MINEQKEIPKILFSKRNKAQIEFEIFPIRSLFARQDKLDHPLNTPHYVEFYHIFFVIRGSGEHFIDFRPYQYGDGSILFVSKGQVQAFDVSANVDGYMILFTEDFLSKNMIHSDILSFYRLYNYHLHKPVITPDEAGMEIFSNTVSEMYFEYQLSNNFAKEEILRLLLKLFLLRAERCKRTLIPREKNTLWFSMFCDFKDHLEKRCTETRNAQEYANIMGISYKHLNTICKSITGVTAKTFIDQFIVLEIQRRMAVYDISVKELTYEMGFDEPTNFVKFYKKHTGLSPAQFKKNLKK
jgi:AraC-like DNA-binding protein